MTEVRWRHDLLQWVAAVLCPDGRMFAARNDCALTAMAKALAAAVNRT